MMAGLDDNSTGDGKTGKLASGRHNIYNSGFIGKLTCSTCNDAGVEVNHNISEITEGIVLPIDERYYDKYDYSTSNITYTRGKLGDATKEMGPFQNAKYGSQTRYSSSWYNDESWFIYLGGPWVTRGGDYTYGIGSGLFHFNTAHGFSFGGNSFRLVLAF